MKTKTMKAISYIRNARGLIDMVRGCLLAQRLLKDNSIAPDLMPVMECLLLEADVNELLRAEEELKSIEFPLCGAALDPGECCDCQDKEKAAPMLQHRNGQKVESESPNSNSTSIVQKDKEEIKHGIDEKS